MTREQVLDAVLPTLFDNFEAGSTRAVTLTPSRIEEYEPLRELVGELNAEGSLMIIGNAYRLTSAGYIKHKPRVDALRALGRSVIGDGVVIGTVAVVDPKEAENERKRKIVRDALSSFDAADSNLFQYILDNGETAVKALALTQQFGRNLYQTLERAERRNLLKKHIRDNHTLYSVNPELRSALGFVLAAG